MNFLIQVVIAIFYFSTCNEGCIEVFNLRVISNRGKHRHIECCPQASPASPVSPFAAKLPAVPVIRTYTNQRRNLPARQRSRFLQQLHDAGGGILRCSSRSLVSIKTSKVNFDTSIPTVVLSIISVLPALQIRASDAPGNCAGYS